MQRADAKVMVLAAGLGTRLEPLTDELPKPLVPLGDRSLLEHVLGHLGAQGFLPVAVNSFHRSALFRSIAGRLDGIAAIVDEPELRGTAGGVTGALGVLAPGPVLVTNADVLSSVDFAELRARTPAEGLCLAVVPRARGEGTLGLGAGGRVVRLRGERFGEELEGGDYVGTLGIGVARRAGLPARGCLIGDVALPLARSGAVLATVRSAGGLVAPGDSLGDYLAENLAWLSARGERAYTDPSASVAAGIDLDRVIVGARATVEGTGRLERVGLARCTRRRSAVERGGHDGRPSDRGAVEPPAGRAMITSQVDASADPLAIARALAGRPALSLVRAADGSATYVACDPVEVSAEVDPEPALPLEPRAHGEIPRWIGLLPYEAQRSLERPTTPDHRLPPDISEPRWMRYDSIIKISNKVEIISSSSRALEELRRLLERGLRRAPTPRTVAIALTRAEPGRVHIERIRAALELIGRGEIYQVNLARRFLLRVEGQAQDLLALLCPSGLTRCAAALEWPGLTVAAATPELFLKLNPDHSVLTSPIKGTRPRAVDVAEDAALARSLDADPKERAELAMVIDVERNDLGRLARPGTVALTVLPHVETLETVHHRLATVRAELPPEIGRRALLEATLPSGSVTGAPKVRAMEVIRDLEAARRGLYTGALGFVRQDGGLELGMAIRTLTVTGGEGSYFAGGGIVADSDPGREVEETLWKARRLIEASGGRFENWA